jgi:glycosyltransferase involved in cell wall biosynthesis
MRVLVISNVFPPRELGGYERTCAAFVRHLRDLGHVVRVLTSDHPPTRAMTAGEEWPGVDRVLRFRGLQDRPVATLKNDRRDLGVALRTAREWAPDAITLWGMNGLGRALVPGLRAADVPVSARVGDNWLENLLRLRARHRGAKRLARAALGVPLAGDLGHVRRWVFNSRYMLESARSLGLDAPDASVVHSGVDVDAIPRRPPAPWRGRLLYLGRIDGHKGVDTAVRAVAEVEGASLRVVGPAEPAALSELSALIDESRASDRVEIRPPVDRQGAIAELGRADAVLFPARWPEPWGKVPLEAMAAGVPVIASGTGGSAEYLRHGENALVAAPDDPGVWAQAIGRVAQDESLRATLRQAGFATAARYSERRANDGLVRELLGIA